VWTSGERRPQEDDYGTDGRLGLRVADDGVGFVPGAFADTGRLGLRGLRDLVREAGGSLDVDSGPGRGTTVRLEVAAR
jgi:signal transduction histidine kinase